MGQPLSSPVCTELSVIGEIISEIGDALLEQQVARVMAISVLE